MENLDRVMLWHEAVDLFKRCELPTIRHLEKQNGFHSHIDGPMRREAWNNFTDALCKDGQISDWQYENWSQPECCEKEPRW